MLRKYPSCSALWSNTLDIFNAIKQKWMSQSADLHKPWWILVLQAGGFENVLYFIQQMSTSCQNVWWRCWLLPQKPPNNPHQCCHQEFDIYFRNTSGAWWHVISELYAFCNLSNYKHVNTCCPWSVYTTCCALSIYMKDYCCDSQTELPSWWVNSSATLRHNALWCRNTGFHTCYDGDAWLLALSDVLSKVHTHSF